MHRESAGALWLLDEGHAVRAGLERLVGWLAGQHDLGKATVGFQAKWPEGRVEDEAAGLTFPAHLLRQDRHDLSSAQLLQRRLPPELAGAVAAHHGYQFSSAEVANARLTFEPAGWKVSRDDLLKAYDATLSIDAASIAWSPRFSLPEINWLSGLTSVADWIGSNTTWFPPGERGKTLREHHEVALRLAEAALDDIGWPLKDAPSLSVIRGLDTVALLERACGRSDVQPRPLQLAVDRLIPQVRGPSLVIVEAPMGEGKTEFALMAHARLLERLHGRGLFIGLPTQATGNAMFPRVLGFFQRLDPESRVDLQLAHGAAQLDERLHVLRGVHGEPGDNVRCSAWFSQGKRALLSPNAVGTIDQVLYATLNVKHHFVRLWGLSQRVVVLDEVHAYDSYTGGLIESLLRWLRSMDCSVILMSATLPDAKRADLLEAWGATTQVPVADYPRVTLVQQTGSDTVHVPARSFAPIHLGWTGSTVEDIGEFVARAMESDGCVGVIVNTVDRAQALYRYLRPRLSDDVVVHVFHARFPAEDRLRIEQSVLQDLGSGGQRPRRALLIATQVAEQSLDIDLDLLVSDLAPVDLLLQRAGRLHRHVRPRPAAHEVARFVIAGLDPRQLPELQRTGWDSVYDPYLLGRTWAFVSRESAWQFPGDIDRLVQTVYGDAQLPGGLPQAAQDYIEGVAWGAHLADELQMSRFAASAAVDPRLGLFDAYAGKPHGREAGEGLGAENRTRFGEDGLGVVPVHIGPDGWSLEPGAPTFDPAQVPGPDMARRLLKRQIKVSRRDLVKALTAEEPPAAWAQHPWLRDLRPLPMGSDGWHAGRLHVRLDPVLGLVVGRSTSAVSPSTPEIT